MYYGTLNNYPRRLLGDFNSTVQSQIAEANREIEYWQNEVNMYPDSTNALAQLNFWKARLQALQLALQRGPTYIATHTGNQIDNWTQQFLSRLNQQIIPGNNNYNYQNNNQVPPGGDLFDTFTQNIAGLPLWGWILIAGAAVWIIPNMISESKKRT